MSPDDYQAACALLALHRATCGPSCHDGDALARDMDEALPTITVGILRACDLCGGGDVEPDDILCGTCRVERRGSIMRQTVSIRPADARADADRTCTYPRCSTPAKWVAQIHADVMNDETMCAASDHWQSAYHLPHPNYWRSRLYRQEGVCTSHLSPVLRKCNVQAQFLIQQLVAYETALQTGQAKPA